jgi:cytochrome P450
MLVASIDTVTSSTAKIFYVLSRDAKLRAAMIRSVNDHDVLTKYCMEALRRWPHNPTLARVVAEDTDFEGSTLRKGRKLLVWTQAAVFDPSVFLDPEKMLPDRPPRNYFHFGEGLHWCTGRMIGELQMPMMIGKLLSRGYVIDGKMKWAGPFPDLLPIKKQGN